MSSVTPLALVIHEIRDIVRMPPPSPRPHILRLPVILPPRNHGADIVKTPVAEFFRSFKSTLPAMRAAIHGER